MNIRNRALRMLGIIKPPFQVVMIELAFFKKSLFGSLRVAEFEITVLSQFFFQPEVEAFIRPSYKFYAKSAPLHFPQQISAGQRIQHVVINALFHKMKRSV